ncbi:predicted protein [Arabidopsis lyrata subsp. lyrata]|uniref:Predicted protein n=1 Tax=Arabidopsis lyrata subsp. lyrata TaxID=81972 RepID=D7MC51_ARALL|nr:predicted protein [Arabidopsis lyrata subsp. lyrata]
MAANLPITKLANVKPFQNNRSLIDSTHSIHTRDNENDSCYCFYEQAAKVYQLWRVEIY